jgi:hypothetical protein
MTLTIRFELYGNYFTLILRFFFNLSKGNTGGLSMHETTPEVVSAARGIA